MPYTDKFNYNEDFLANNATTYYNTKCKRIT